MGTVTITSAHAPSELLFPSPENPAFFALVSNSLLLCLEMGPILCQEKGLVAKGGER